MSNQNLRDKLQLIIDGYFKSFIDKAR